MEIVSQDGIKDCGISCLLSIIRFYGGEVPKEYLREITHTTKEGVSLYNLLEGAKQLGFDVVGLTGNLEDIEVNNLPCIVHFIINKNYKHFVVLYEINKKKQEVTLMDPAKGKKIISFSEYNLLSSKNYLFLKPIKKLPRMLKKNIIYKNIKEIIKENKLTLFLIIFLTISYFIINLISSFHFKYILEYSINYNISKNIFIITYLIIFLYLLKNINSYIRNILLSKWTSIFDLNTTTLTYRELLLLPYLYYKNRTSGEVISRFKDLNTIRTYISNFFLLISTDLITLIIFFTVMIKYNKLITLIILIPISISLFSTILINKKKKKILPKINISTDKTNSYIIEGISNVDTIKGFHLEKRMIDKFKIHYKNLLGIIYKYNFIVETNNFIKTNINDSYLTIIYLIGGIQVINNKISLSSLIIYQTFFNYFINSFSRLTSLIEEYNSYKIALDRVEEIFMIRKDNFKNNYFYLSYKLDGDIVFNKLNYKVGSKYLFKDLNLNIKKGEKILLSGESGSGKSTLLKMLLRYIDVDFNHIKISNIDINHYHLENIRSNITYVTNNEYLFNDTLRNNILLYREINEEEFTRICNICLVDDIIKNNITGYDTMIEENGFNYSNGERQRIILARSILRNSNIYIFDEALSGIDITKEKKVLENIFSYLKDKTVIVISHRFNNKKCFDRVLKLENGKIYES